MARLRFWVRHWRLSLLLILLAGAAIAHYTTGLRDYFQPSGVALLRADVLGAGWRGAALFVAVYVVFVTLGLPNLPFQLAAGALYGVGPAYAMMLVGVNLGALGAFGLARRLGRHGIEALAGSRLKALNQRIEQGGFRFLLILRLVPLLPFNAINYAAGISRLRVRPYLAANLIGMLPLTFVHVLFGHAAGELRLSDPSSWRNPELLLPLVAAALMLALAIILHRRRA